MAAPVTYALLMADSGGLNPQDRFEESFLDLKLLPIPPDLNPLLPHLSWSYRSRGFQPRLKAIDGLMKIRHKEQAKGGRRSTISCSAERLIPVNATLERLREAAAECRACPLWEKGTQTVFGAGGRQAKVVFVGEQPGFDEDLTGKPFVGPAG